MMNKWGSHPVYDRQSRNLPCVPRMLVSNAPQTCSRGSKTGRSGMKLKLVFVLLGGLFVTPAVAAPETFVIDMPHSFSNFEVGHLGINWIHGRFNKTSGKITLDRATNKGINEAE